VKERFVRKELMSLPNFEVISCMFYISNTTLMFVDMEGFPKRDFAKLSCKTIMLSKASLSFMVLNSPTLHVFIY
jgi:hypothetical protein